jgi:hypothetical protein
LIASFVCGARLHAPRRNTLAKRIKRLEGTLEL